MIFKRKKYFHWIIPFFVLLILMVLNVTVHADYQTNLLPGEYIQDGSVDLNVGKFSVPLVYDWNSDGYKDLLVGQRYDDVDGSNGYVSFFENLGSDNAPYFDGSTHIMSCNAECSPVNVSAWG